MKAILKKPGEKTRDVLRKVHSSETLLSYSTYQLYNFYDIRALTTIFSNVSGSFGILKCPGFGGILYIVIN